VAGAWLSAGGARTYVLGNRGDESNPRCEIWAVDVDTIEYVGPTIEVDQCEHETFNTVSTTPDASRLAFTYVSREHDGWATNIYDGRTGELLGALQGLTIAVISPDGTLVGAGPTGEVTQYDLETLEPIGAFPGARGFVDFLQFSTDGRLLLVGSANRNLSIYDVTTRSRLGDPIETGRTVVGGNAGPSLRPDGKTVAVNGREGLAVWSLEPDRLAEAACRLAGRNLTPTEWDAYLGHLGDYRATCPDNP
jgi:WD40 repeat protein